MYRFYAYPDRLRLRVSQILVLPAHQRRGVGRALLLAAYKAAHACNAVDVTVRSLPLRTLPEAPRRHRMHMCH